MGGPSLWQFRKTMSLQMLKSGARQQDPFMPSFAIDLTYGSIRPQEAAHQLARQLNRDLSNEGHARDDKLFAGMRFIETAEVGVDMESRGRVAIENAWNHALFLAPLVDAPVHIYPALFGCAFDDADAAFVTFLTDLLPEGMVATHPAPNLLDQQEVKQGYFVPGLISTNQLQRLALCPDDVIPLANGVCMVRPEYRVAPDRISAAEWNWSAVINTADPWIAAYAMLHADAEMTLPHHLNNLIEVAYANDYADLAMTYAAHLQQRAKNKAERALWTVRLQGMRIGKMRFEQASREAISGDEPADLLGFLYLTSGWGHIMTGQAQEADVLFTKARAHMQGWTTRPEYLYVMNISALAQARLGHLDTAEQMELDIERQLALQNGKARSMEYINAINLHRLYRMRHDPEKAEHHLRRAESANAGTRSWNDGIYLAHNWYRMAHSKGDDKAAFAHLVACALMYAANEHPESLATRTVAGLLAMPWPLRASWTVDELTECLTERLREAARKQGLTGGEMEHAAPTFVKKERLEPDDEIFGVQLDPLGVLVLDRPLKLRRRASAAKKRFYAVLGAVLAEQNSGHWPWPAVIVDDRFGRGLPMTVAQLQAQVLGLGGTALFSGPHAHPIPPDIQKKQYIRLAPGVEHITGCTISFRRIYSDVTVSQEMAAILHHLEEAPNQSLQLPEMSKHETVLARQLERKRIIIIDIPDEALEITQPSGNLS
jgi:hypothetical protein